MATYAVSDLHGYFEVFERGLKEISFSEQDKLYVIGDAIDRGPEGIRILQTIMQNDNMELLLGNHEYMMLNSVSPDGERLCDGRERATWIITNGGGVTFDAYCELSLAERKALLFWLEQCYLIKTLTLGERKICLTHSYYEPSCENMRYFEVTIQKAFYIVWTSVFREDRYTHGKNIYGDYPMEFITGHVPVHRIMRMYEGKYNFNRLELYQRGNFIDIDGGLAMGRSPEIENGAIFLRLEDMRAFPVPLVT